MSNQSKASAKELEGKLESASGELTGDLGHQIKGKAKQVQAAAMKTGEQLSEGAKKAKEKISHAADKLKDNLDSSTP